VKRVFDMRQRKQYLLQIGMKKMGEKQLVNRFLFFADTLFYFFHIEIKLTTDDRQNEPINHRLRAGQESSNFGLPMKAVCLL